jgi:ABC-type oligopeptide transport system substrate-binding subunit
MEGPRGYFPVLAAFSAALPAHRASVEKYGDGDKWTTADKIVSNGPFKLIAWERERYWETQKNPDYWDANNIKLQKTIRPIIPYSAFLIADENDEVDWIDRGPIGELKRVQSDPKLSKEMLTFSHGHVVPGPARQDGPI